MWGRMGDLILITIFVVFSWDLFGSSLFWGCYIWFPSQQHPPGPLFTDRNNPVICINSSLSLSDHTRLTAIIIWKFCCLSGVPLEILQVGYSSRWASKYFSFPSRVHLSTWTDREMCQFDRGSKTVSVALDNKRVLMGYVGRNTFVVLLSVGWWVG